MSETPAEDIIPPVLGDPGRRLTDKEYEETYETGDGGHPIPLDVLADLDGWDDPEAVPQ